MNKLLFTTLALFALSNAAAPSFFLGEVKSLFSTWRDIHNKAYTDVHEEGNRFEVFYHNYAKVVTHNSENQDFKLALNKFADLTAEEFKAQVVRGGYKFNKEAAQKKKALREADSEGFTLDYSLLSLPKSWDWREHGAVTPVKNQGECGSCWTFSSTGALEGLHYIKHKTLLSFSEQQLVDCVTDDYGCNGGIMSDAFTYTAEKGIEAEAHYPYTAKDGKCKYSAKYATEVNKGYKNITPQSSSALKAALVIQPVSVAVEADEEAFQFYSSGVVKSGCGDNLDHGVLAVGYKVIDGAEAFIVKNSWGADWGDEGYLHISTSGKANGGNGVCGILMDPVAPVAK